MDGVMMPSTSEAITIVSFPIEGMTCASCVNRITRHLRKTHGVDRANVNLATESATVRFDPAVTDVVKLAQAVEAAGYVARTDQLEANEPVANETKHHGQRHFHGCH